jgi:hypothetical protein
MERTNADRHVEGIDVLVAAIPRNEVSTGHTNRAAPQQRSTIPTQNSTRRADMSLSFFGLSDRRL